MNDVLAATFDQAAVERLKRAAVDVVGGFPEVRAVIVVVDYHNDLNRGGTEYAAWVGERGPVKQAAEVFGAAQQLSRVQAMVMGTADKILETSRQQLAVLAGEAVRRQTDGDLADATNATPPTAAADEAGPG